MAANVTFRMLDCIAGRGYNVQARCRCRHIGVVSGPLAVQWFMIHRWPRALEVAPMHFRCSECARRNTCELRPIATHVPLTFPRWGPHSDRDWQRRIRQLRG